MVKFSEEQKSIINAARSNILVSAAAGSGKTTVLSARITSKILSREVEIDELLIVTFTKDAAAHMREKIEESLRKALLEPGSDKKYIKSQIDKIPSSYIQTMDSFCNRVVVEAGHMCSDEHIMEPGCTVLDKKTLDMLLSESALESVLAVYDRITAGELSEQEKNDFLSLVFSMGDGKSETPVAKALVKTYEKLRSLPDYLNVVDSVVDYREKADSEGIVLGMARYVETQDAYLRYLRTCCEPSRAKVGDTGVSADLQNQIHGLINAFEEVLDRYIESVSGEVSLPDKCKAVNRVYSEVYSDARFDPCPKLCTKKDQIDAGFSSAYGPIAGLFAVIRKERRADGQSLPNNGVGFNDISGPFEPKSDYDIFRKCDVDTLLSLQARRSACIRAYARLIKDTDLRFEKHKKLIRGIDFPDMSHMCYRILKTPEARDLYKNRFKEIYIDEYQDNTSLQDAIVDLFADDNVFCVGDVKQSIYKFRNANPSMFIRKSEAYKNDPSSGKLMGLNCNFRSSPQVLAFVNELFGQLMSGGAAEIDYDGDNHQLNPSPIAKEGNVPEVILINAKKTENVSVQDSDSEDGAQSDGDSEQAEVKQMELLVGEVVNKVKEYLRAGYTPGEIFVLSRTNAPARLAARVLRDNDIPSRCVEEHPLFTDNEITGICNLIKILANEYRDECLAGVMLAPYRFSNFTLDEMAEIVCSAPDELKAMNLIIKVKNYAVNGSDEGIKNRCAAFVDAIDDLRAEGVIRDISELVELIYVKSGIKATLMDETPREADKLDAFKNWLCENFLRRGGDLSEVANFIELMQTRLDDKKGIENDLGGENVVRCMSYHKSKGLENKCVIVADVDSKGDTDTNLFISFKAGNVLDPEDPYGPVFVADDYDEDRSIVTTSAEKAAVREINKLEKNAEDLRLLYVALTRAEENLCFIRRVEMNGKPMKKLASTLKSEGKYLSSNFYKEITGIPFLMLAALLRTRAAREIADLRNDYGLDDLNYHSAFDQVRISIKGAQAVVNSMNEASSPSDDVPVDIDLDLPFEIDGADESEVSGADWRGQSIYGSKGTDNAGMPKFETYRFEDSMKAPAKTSVSAMKQLEDSVYSSEKEDDLKVAINLIVPGIDDYIGEKNGLSGAALGTAVHKTMSFIDLVRLAEDPSVSAQSELDALCEEGILTSAEREAVGKFADHIQVFVSSDIGRALATADKEGRAEREKSLVCALRINPDRDDYTLVQGTLDAMYTDTDGEAVIIDYKTDYLKTDDPAEIKKIIKERHGAQLELYAAAVEESGIKVKARYIVLLRKDMVIEV